MLKSKFGPAGTEFVRHPGRNDPAQGALEVAEAPGLDAYPSRQVVPAAYASADTAPGPSGHLTRPLEPAPAHRQQFWLDTCREVAEMRTASRRVMELHRLYGCRFCPPTARQVQSILAALDAARPGWEQDHPHLFFQTLEMNFPELLRTTRGLPRH